MKATIIDGKNSVLAVVNGEHVHSINKGFIEFYIPKGETDSSLMKGLTEITFEGGTVSFEPNYVGPVRGECVYVAIRPEYVKIDWEA